MVFQFARSCACAGVCAGEWWIFLVVIIDRGVIDVSVSLIQSSRDGKVVGVNLMYKIDCMTVRIYNWL